MIIRSLILVVGTYIEEDGGLADFLPLVMLFSGDTRGSQSAPKKATNVAFGRLQAFRVL